MGSYYSNRCKCISMSIMLFLTGVTLALGVFIYYVGYLQIIEMKINGSPYIPELVVNFSKVEDQLYYSSFSSIIILLLVLPTVYFKMPFLSLLFIICSFLMAGWVAWTAKMFLDFQQSIVGKEDICSLPVMLELNNEFQNLVNLWMCTTDCPCYRGKNNENFEVWQQMKANELAQYSRNMDTKIIKVNGVNTYPFAWTSDTSQAVSSFRECYEKVLVPQRKYTKQWDKFTNHFYKGGGYQMLSEFEDRFGNCSSLCYHQLFYLKKDISFRHSENECLQLIRDHFNQKA